MTTASASSLIAALCLLLCGSAAHAQTCRDDIPATAPDSQFADQSDGTVIDLATGLMWKRCAEGRSGLDCGEGTEMRLDWQAALQQAADAEFAGHRDWRLPNKNELESLVERRCYSPAINSSVFPNTAGGWFWSSSSYAGYPYYAWDVHFYYGYVDGSNEYDAELVRLVRGGQ